MWAYTDYPESEEFSGIKRPLRKIRVLNYDHNKYVEIDQWPYQIKSGYAYRNRRKVPFMNKTLKRKFPEVED